VHFPLSTPADANESRTEVKCLNLGDQTKASSSHRKVTSKSWFANWRNIATALIDLQKGEEKTQACANA